MEQPSLYRISDCFADNKDKFSLLCLTTTDELVRAQFVIPSRARDAAHKG